MSNKQSSSPRIAEQAVQQALAVAQSRWPGQRVFLLSDTAMRLPGTLDMRDLPAGAADQPIAGSVFVCAFDSDQKALPVLEAIQTGGGHYVNALQYQPPATYLHKNDIARRVLAEDQARAQRDGLAHFDRGDFTNLLQCLEITRELPGAYVEIGVYQGSSARTALHYMAEAGIERRSYFLDTFTGFAYEEAATSADGRWWNTHGETSLERVRGLLAEYSCAVQRCNICTEPLPAEIDAIALCNIDVDLYEAVLAALRQVAGKIVPRGVIIVEDVGHTPGLGGAALALHQFMRSEQGEAFVQIYMESGQALLLRMS